MHLSSTIKQLTPRSKLEHAKSKVERETLDSQTCVHSKVVVSKRYQTATGF